MFLRALNALKIKARNNREKIDYCVINFVAREG